MWLMGVSCGKLDLFLFSVKDRCFKWLAPAEWLFPESFFFFCRSYLSNLFFSHLSSLFVPSLLPFLLVSFFSTSLFPRLLLSSHRNFLYPFTLLSPSFLPFSLPYHVLPLFLLFSFPSFAFCSLPVLALTCSRSFSHSLASFPLTCPSPFAPFSLFLPPLLPSFSPSTPLPPSLPSFLYAILLPPSILFLRSSTPTLPLHSVPPNPPFHSIPFLHSFPSTPFRSFTPSLPLHSVPRIPSLPLHSVLPFPPFHSTPLLHSLPAAHPEWKESEDVRDL